jgi:hypothetical protein
MRLPALLITLAAVTAFAGCTPPAPVASDQTTNTNTSRTTTQSQTSNAPSPDMSRDVPVAPAHGGGAVPPNASNAAAPPANSNSTASEQTGMDTAALDAKIEKAEAKAKAKNATQADRVAAAAAYMERADIFMNAGRPMLYKFALRDYRRTLHYEPDNAQARQSVKTIVDIYNSMGRPVPELGNEP